ncbi:hypothetical protein [Ekhidna sp.]|uniref:hypothetical protein n=1 Tax=Ekhidna sp. TaxID=2608089 RepID=UPI003CCC173F
MKTSSKFLWILFLSFGFVVGCSDDDDHDHDHDGEEAINEVVLTFTPTGSGNEVSATWFDPDADGTENPTIGTIDLVAGVTYTLDIELSNTLEGEDKTSEIAAEADEHMFFFAFTNDIFSDPTGNGNIDNRSDAVNYEDEDDNGLPLGLETSWTTGSSTASSGTFQIILKHQPGLKTADSGVSVGGTDLDISFEININD